ncbi:uncharacterized protein TRIVIDRAFT_227452 [Trichoderma virens Gv29-8]|uniref:Uncharacterized protein n=1 Tax=Hypocrea virens (strain Gv29-8 / FGSC 10586) TaxID=413071 RepID=G9N9I0_HYPVG|nr:uncharacterized protein TRIVIDRAFT_227452 [Trichoderma virens Gv29-8]EHK16600.1 hypothetical protein TRIVIDRAFT_227452 [Trichoderma virens Gv29-8]UKZ52024.1 hypothetical protein TrVGV298_005791 [Trichoderma virens]
MEVVCTDADGRRRVGNGFAYKCKSHAGGFKQLFRRDRCESQFSTDGATESVTAEGDCTCWIARFGNGPLARESGTETAERARTRLGFWHRVLQDSAILEVLESVHLRREEDEIQARIGSWSGVEDDAPTKPPFSVFKRFEVTRARRTPNATAGSRELAHGPNGLQQCP